MLREMIMLMGGGVVTPVIKLLCLFDGNVDNSAVGSTAIISPPTPYVYSGSLIRLSGSTIACNFNFSFVNKITASFTVPFTTYYFVYFDNVAYLELVTAAGAYGIHVHHQSYKELEVYLSTPSGSVLVATVGDYTDHGLQTLTLECGVGGVKFTGFGVTYTQASPIIISPVTSAKIGGTLFSNAYFWADDFTVTVE